MNQEDSGETSPGNPRAIRGASGVWNEDTLPIMEWEDPEQRVVLPIDLQQALGLDTSVLRWDREKYDKVVQDHSRDQVIIRDLSRYLERWTYVGEEQDHPDHYRVLLQAEARWYAVTIGPLLGATMS